MSSFGDQLHSFSRSTGIRFDKIVRKVCLDLTRDIVKLTPVGNPDLWKHPAPPGYTGGMARSNWFLGYSRVTDTHEEHSKNGAPSLRRASNFASTIHGGGVFYIVNNLPYIMALEYGSSTQAPAGMARVTVERFQGIVNAAVGAR